MAKVKKTDTCWLWQGSIVGNGYGNIYVNNKKNDRTHRVAWKIFHGEIPKGMHVLHHCDVRHCVNPDHLFLGNHRINFLDMRSKGRRNTQLAQPMAEPS